MSQRASRSVVVLGLALVLAGCAGTADQVDRAGRTTHSALSTSAGPALDLPSFSVLPVGREPVVGHAYRFRLLTHCGIDHLNVGSTTVWHATVPAPDFERLPGRGDDVFYTGDVAGVLTRPDEDTIEFVVDDATASIDGQSFTFTLTDDEPLLCD